MNWIDNIIFVLILVIGVGFFIKNVKKLKRNILLGKKINRRDQPTKRWLTMARVALGQGKMTVRPIAGILHIVVYLGFIVINLEVLEIILDGILGTHRIFAFMGGFYNFLIASFEILAFLVIISIITFWIRRNVIKIKRFWNSEMKGWPKDDANYILYIELLLMFAFLKMNGADLVLQSRGIETYIQAGSFPISSWMFAAPMEMLSTPLLEFIERASWWFHIVGILFFLNYLYYSKHLHIILAFPNTYFSKLEQKGTIPNLTSVTNEVKMMLDPSFTPDIEEEVSRFGAKDATDLNWVQLMNSYSCTECGRCTDECPANQTGKLLSPRKVMMDTRDRITEIGNNMDKNGSFQDDGKSLYGDYLTAEEIWACTSCNACTQACPVNIDPLSIIMDIRQYAVMEESSAPTELNVMMTNLENNGAPWPFSLEDKLNWAKES